MDAKIKTKIAELQKAFEQEELRISQADPIAKMLLVALAHQANQIEQKIDSSVERLSTLFCEQVILNSDLYAQPAVSVVKIGNSKEYAPYRLDEKVSFTYKPTKCTYRPLFNSQIIPGELAAYYAADTLILPYQEPIKAQKTNTAPKGEIWLAYESAGETETLEGVTLALNHPIRSSSDIRAEICDTIFPVHLALEEEICGLSPNFMLIEYWKQHLIHQNLWLYRFGSSKSGKAIRRTEMPGWLSETFNPEALASLANHRYLWIRLYSDTGCSLPPATEIQFNCIPVANYDTASVKLSYSEPIQRLENEKTGAQFLGVVQDAELADEYFIRDFDVAQYDNHRIQEDILNLYRHYVDDYYAFVNSNALHDGAILRTLRSAMVQVYDALEDFRPNKQTSFKGTYAIRHPRNNQQPIAISYFATHGRRGNLLKKGALLTASYVAVGEVTALVDAAGGRDKITGTTTRRELAKFSVHSNDRLFTKIDFLQYAHLEWLRAFGDDSLKFCEIDTEMKNLPVDNHIEKCLFIIFRINSERLYEEALETNFLAYLEINMKIRKSFSCEVRVRLVNIDNF